MKILVLGSAAGGGFPQWNCNCANCRGLRQGTLRAKARTQSSIAVSADGTDWVLINASPDILAQIKALPQLQPARTARDTGIRAVILVDSQIDHTVGLFMLREGEALPIYCTPNVREDLENANPILRVLESYCRTHPHPIPTDGAGHFTVGGFDSLAFTALAVDGKAPPFSPHRNDPRRGDNLGLMVEDRRSKRKLFYAPGLARVEADTAAWMEQADCLLVDGTFWTDDEMLRQGVGHKRASEMGHLPQSGPDGMLAQLARLSRPRKILIHINNTNPILNEDGPERRELARQGVEVAFDGMEIEL